jgi:hypothetical protein
MTRIRLPRTITALTSSLGVALLLAPAARSGAQFPTRADTATAADTAAAVRALGTLDSLIVRSITVEAPTTTALTREGLRGQPGSSAGSTGAFGAQWGDFFFGGGYQARTRFTRVNDGSVSAGFGLGNPTEYVGLEVAFSSASTFRQGFGKNGSMSLKLHRILPHYFGVAVGLENVASWGGTDGGSSVYGVVSHNFVFREDATAFLGSLAWNVGVGNNRYLREQDLVAGNTGVNAFASGGLRIHERAALVLDWTGQDLASVISFVPIRSAPLVVSAGWADLTHTAGDGPRFIVGAGVGFKAKDVFGHGPHLEGDRDRR